MKVAVDIETRDPHLKSHGDGSIRKDGEILGVGMYSEENPQVNGYWPATSDIVRDVLSNSNITKIFHNGVYDLTWLQNGYDLEVKGRIEDTMTREYLLDAYASQYNLDACCHRRGVEGKNYADTIDAWWFSHGGKGKAVEHLSELPHDVVAKYCLQDCMATYNLFGSQSEPLSNEHLEQANDIEARLYPLLMAMKKNGIRVDNEARERLSNTLNQRLDEGWKEIHKKYPWFDSLTAPTQLKRIWIEEGIPFHYTDQGNPSFAADILADIDNPIIEHIRHMRTISTALTKFVDGAIQDYKYAGFIYPTFFPALRDEGGTITGRFSCRDPNMQNISARSGDIDEGGKFGEEIRSLFIPLDDHFLFAPDYSQIEYRLFLNYACGSGAEEAKARFRDDPFTDYHQMVMEMMGWQNLGKEGRHLTKNLNFGSIYGLGAKSFAVKFRKNLMNGAMQRGLTCEQYAQMRMDEYFKTIPFVRPTMRAIQNKGQTRGFVRTVSGRRQRMPSDNKAYKLVNYLCQGGASDILKKGLVDAWEAGVFNIVKIHATVHDENVTSVPYTKEGIEAAKQLHDCMENAYRLHVPIIASWEAGNNWGHCTEGFFDETKKSICG
jgi:DNA polymerase-1